MNAQEAFNTIINYFSREGAVLAIKDGLKSCLYRTESGNKCAVGCLIPDELYRPWMEAGRIENLLYTLNSKANNPSASREDRIVSLQVLEIINGSDPEKDKLLRDLQTLHDHCAKDAEDFVRLARVYGAAKGYCAFSRVDYRRK